MKTTLLLASASPRRRQLVQLFGLPVRSMAMDVDEDIIQVKNPALNALATAGLKTDAAAVALSGSDEALIVIGVDTNVAFGDVILGKPVDAADARRMLRLLRGKTHQVHTGVVLIRPADGRVETEIASIDVPMRDYSDAEIEAYIKSGDPFDKAGGYAIQHPIFSPAPNLSGCYAGVMGLPLCHIARALARFGVKVSAETPHQCQLSNQYTCTVYDTYFPA